MPQKSHYGYNATVVDNNTRTTVSLTHSPALSLVCFHVLQTQQEKRLHLFRHLEHHQYTHGSHRLQRNTSKQHLSISTAGCVDQTLCTMVCHHNTHCTCGNKSSVASSSLNGTQLLIHLSIQSSIGLPIHLAAHPSVYPSVHLSIHH